MSHITSVSPPVPTNPPLGTTWTPEEAKDAQGPIAEHLEPYKEIIRVRKTCRQCTEGFDGWMFTSTYRHREAKLEKPYHVGLHRFCPSCQAADEKRGEVARLDTIIEHTRKRWESARHLKDKMPAGRELAKHLGRMMELLRFGSDRFAAASDQFDAVNGWLLSNQPEM